MATKYIIYAAFTAIDKMTAPIATMGAKTKQFTKTLRPDIAKAERSMMKFGDSLKTAGKFAIAGLGVGISLVLKDAIQLASDLAEVQNVVDVSFGKSAKQINEWSNTALDAFGLSELQAKKFTGTMGAMLKSSGLSGDSIVKMSTDLTGLTGDFASFYNLDHEEAFTKIRSGISGETEPLKQLGINMSVANLEAFALTQGITKQWKSMTQAEQVLLRYNYLMKVSKDAQGDFARTSQGFANQQRTLATRFKEVSANIAKEILPTLTEMFAKINEGLKKVNIQKIGNTLKMIVKVASVLINILIKLSPLIISAAVAWGVYKAVVLGAIIAQGVMNGLFAIGKFMQFIRIIMMMTKAKGLWVAVQWALNAALTANPIGLIIVGIGILIGLIILLVLNWKKVSAAVVDFYEKFKPFLAMVSMPLVTIIEIIKSIVSNWGNIKKGFTDGGILGGILAIGKAILQGILAPIQSVLELLSKLPGIGKLFGAGANMIKGFSEGLFENGQVQSPMTPSERSTLIQKETTNKSEVTIKDKTGKSEITKNPKGNSMSLKLQTSGAF